MTDLNELLFQRNSIPAIKFSRRLSRALGRVVAVIDEGDLPYTPTDSLYVDLNDEQLRERALFVKKRIEETFPSVIQQIEAADAEQWKEFWEKRKGVKVGTMHGAIHVFPTSQDTHPQMFRLKGSHFIKFGFILAPSGQHTPIVQWRDLTGLGSNLEYFPEGNFIADYKFIHEVAHLLQAYNFGIEGDVYWRWHKERNADILSHEQMEIRAEEIKISEPQDAIRIRDTVMAAKQARVLRSFLKPYEGHMVFSDLYANARITLPEGINVHRHNVIALASFISNTELRLRTIARLQGAKILQTSSDLQSDITRYNRAQDLQTVDPDVRPFFAVIGTKISKNSNDDPRDFLPALRDVVTSREADLPFTQQHGELILKAVRRFGPSLLSLPSPFPHPPLYDSPSSDTPYRLFKPDC